MGRTGQGCDYLEMDFFTKHSPFLEFHLSDSHLSVAHLDEGLVSRLRGLDFCYKRKLPWYLVVDQTEIVSFYNRKLGHVIAGRAWPGIFWSTCRSLLGGDPGGHMQPVGLTLFTHL